MKFKDRKGLEFAENDVVKVFHYCDPCTDEKIYMYKWIRERDGSLYFLHLSAPEEPLVPLMAACNPDGVWEYAEIVPNYRKGL